MSSSTNLHPDQTGEFVPGIARTLLGAAEPAAPKCAAVARWDWTELGGAPGLVDKNRSGTQPGSAGVEGANREEAAYRRGVIAGKEALQETVGRELALAKSAALSAVDEVRKHGEAWTARLQDNLVALAVAIARQIVEREIEQDPEIFLDLARKAIAAFPLTEPVKLRLHPDDLALLITDEANVDESMISVGDRMVPWISDEETVRGGCLVEGPVKIVDGRLDKALQRVYRKLTDG